MTNPLFPLNEYIPDGEPHVYGDRVYLYGSHDKENGDRFCMQDYTVYSASIYDLNNWTSHGISYRKENDPRSRKDKLVDLYAPDCVKGNDGRYCLYYVAMGPNIKNFGPVSVAVSDYPEGPFDYLSDIKYPDGKPLQKFLTNDPAVLNDDGRIYLYYGWGLGRDFRSKIMAPIYNLVQSKLFERSLSEIKETKPSILSCAVVELYDDMYTVKEGPVSVLDSKTTADKNSDLYNHAFYEAPSIRKFGDLYYLVYSSGENCELAYATSRYPDKDYVYRGVIISNADIGYMGNTEYHMTGGTIHGGIECINGESYIFYHRCTNNTDFSRQACAEKIHIDETGYIKQVEMTMQGLNPEPLAAKGIWPAALCCNLYNGKTAKARRNGLKDVPKIASENEKSYISGINKGTVVGYKYFRFNEVKEILVVTKGSGGRLYISTDEKEADAIRRSKNLSDKKYIDLEESTKWKTFRCSLDINTKKAPLYFVYIGSGRVDLLEFEIR